MSPRGIIYMAFGDNAAKEAAKSIRSLRKSDCNYPVIVVGDTRVSGADFVRWTGKCPFDGVERRALRFKAGRVKPHLYGLSPFECTLYLDADTEIISDITPGFDLLDRWQMAIAKHPGQTIAQLYNKPLAGWYHNMVERDNTIREWGGDGDVPYWNSGVIFFRKCAAVETVFRAWSDEWLRWQQWDEQQALMRAVYKHPLRVCVLPETWNHPHREKAGIIFHNYGRGAARKAK